MKKITTSLLILCLSIGFAQELPQVGEPGKCYVKCITPDIFEDVTETIVVEPAYTVIETVPPTYNEVTEEALIKEEYKVLEIVPAVFETVEISKGTDHQSDVDCDQRAIRIV